MNPDVPPALDPNDPAVLRERALGRKRGLLLIGIVLPVFIVMMFGPQIGNLLAGINTASGPRPSADRSAGKVPGHNSGPYTNLPGIEQSVLADGESWGAYKEAVGKTEADTTELSKLAGVTLVGTQRTLNCERALTGAGRLDCTVWMYDYLTWNGTFSSGHDTIVNVLDEKCAFNYSDRDWTPEQWSSRQEPVSCDGREAQMFVHWTPGQFMFGSLACDDTWYNACSPSTARIDEQMAAADWHVRVAIGYRFTVDTK